jgi:hypothetical protein
MVTAWPNVLAFCASLTALFVLGDLLSTMLYHVPQHIWGKLHLRTHHDNTRSYWDHSIISIDPGILLDGFLGALPYFVLAGVLACLGPAAAAGALVGLVLGQLHVMYRHTCELGWKSPAWLTRAAHAAGLVLAEDHNGHHKNPDADFGDIFRFCDAPARAVIAAMRAGARRQRRLQRLREMRVLRSRRSQRSAI